MAKVCAFTRQHSGLVGHWPHQVGSADATSSEKLVEQLSGLSLRACKSTVAGANPSCVGSAQQAGRSPMAQPNCRRQCSTARQCLHLLAPHYRSVGQAVCTLES